MKHRIRGLFIINNHISILIVLKNLKISCVVVIVIGYPPLHDSGLIKYAYNICHCKLDVSIILRSSGGSGVGRWAQRCMCTLPHQTENSLSNTQYTK